MDTDDLRKVSDELFEYAATLLPADLESSARQFGALGRCRHVPNALALVRMLLAYAVEDFSLKDVAAWATANGVAEMSGPGLFYRVRIAAAWMEHLLAQVLERDIAPAPVGWTLRVVDAEHRRIDLNDYEARVPKTGVVQWHFELPVPPTEGGLTKRNWLLRDAVRWIGARVIGSRNLKIGLGALLVMQEARFRNRLRNSARRRKPAVALLL